MADTNTDAPTCKKHGVVEPTDKGRCPECGGWLKGVSGNPGGSSANRRKAQQDLNDAIHQAAPSAGARLMKLIGSGDEQIALKASQYVADRVLGKPTAKHEVDAKEGLAKLMGLAFADDDDDSED